MNVIPAASARRGFSRSSRTRRIYHGCQPKHAETFDRQIQANVDIGKTCTGKTCARSEADIQAGQKTDLSVQEKVIAL
jgi:hypothetical protein